MAPIQFLFTSAFVLSAAVAAPIHSNHVNAGKADASTPSKHQSEPMRMADPVMSSVPMMSIDTQAMKSSAAAMAIQTPPSMADGQQSDGVFGVLNKLPLKRGEGERRQLNEVTSWLTRINSIAKRDGEVEERQLGLIKSVPEALGQAAQVEKLVTNLPIKRDGSGILGGLGGLGGVLGGSVKRDVEEAEKHDETYTEKALKGFQGWIHHGVKDEQETPKIPEIPSTAGLGDIAKRTDPVGGLLTGLLAKRDTKGAEAEAHHETYTEKALKGFQGWIHHGTKADKEATPEVPSAADSLGLDDIAKRADPVSSLFNGIVAERDIEESRPNEELVGEAIHKAETHDDVEHETYTEKALKGFQGWIHHGTKEHKETAPGVPSAADSLGLGDIAKRGSPTDPVTDLLDLLLAKREDSEVDENMLNELAKRSGATDLVTGLLSGVHARRDGPDPGITSLLGGIAKREEIDSDEDMIDGLAKRDIDDAIATASDALTNLAKRNGLDSVDALIKGLTKGGQLNNGLNIRQLNVLSSLATGALGNAGKAAGELGKIATGKHRRGNGDAGSIAAAATAGMNVGNHHKTGDDDESADMDEIAADVAEGEQTLHDATSPQGLAGGLNKRQVPPIAGSDALSIVKGLVAHPDTAFTPVTKGILVGGTALGDMAPQ
ncbi:hypothetical protein TCE0_022r06873 [Talaromyces pinophilus]|uniref:Uncharacterized protein n=1 Tax=Talaromyces pinophilus TaxID=128442 RepID=A0A6V8H903_TALPI|nr:hypothetical protein TCE0_022r06873 [Talaromyces pinophilus]